jgi:hypothetical protein
LPYFWRFEESPEQPGQRGALGRFEVGEQRFAGLEGGLLGGAEDLPAVKGALRSRVVIEQAKGVLADQGNLDMASAFSHSRRHARRTNQRLSDLAASIAARTTSPDVVLGTPVTRDDETRP